MLRRRSFLPALATTAALLAGCGTTVPTSQIRAGGGSDLGDPGLGPGDQQQGTSVDSLTDTQTQAVAPSGDGPTQSSSSTTTGPTTALPTQASSLPTSHATAESGRGFTKTTVQIGIADSDVNSYANTLGAKGISTGDEAAQVNAVISNINAHGGLAGRKIEVVWYHASSAEALNNPAVVSQAACATWTQDHHVFAVVGPIGIPVDKDMLSCLAKTKTPVIGAANPWGIDAQPYFQELYSAFPNFVNIDSMLGETLYRIAIDRLVARKFFEPWNTSTGSAATGPVKPPVKIGVVIHDNPTGKRLLAVISQELAKHGLKVSDVARLGGGVVQQSSDGQNAVLKFHADGITHEIGTAASVFAEAQGWRPRYFVANEPQLIAQNAPAGQMNGSMSESYIPALDVDGGTGPATPAEKQCLKVMTAAKLVPSSGTERYAQQAICDGFFFLRDAVVASKGLSNTGLIPGLESLGSSVSSAMTFSTTISRTQHATASALRDSTYKASCTCFVYDSTKTYS